MSIPLNFDEFTLWISITAVILLITSELLSPHHGRMHTGIDKRKLRNIALATLLLFLSTVAMRIINLFT